jgi:selenocysteine-specific elongation factor
MPKEELKTKLSQTVTVKLFNLAINQLIKENAIVQEENTVRLAAHTVSLGADQAGIRDHKLETYRQAGLQPPYFKELGKDLKIDPPRAKDVLMHLVDEGLIVKIKEDLFFHAEAVEDLKKRLVEFLDSHGEITTPQFKEMIGASRKFVIPLAEYFDAKNVTLRVADVRKLRKG